MPGDARLQGIARRCPPPSFRAPTAARRSETARAPGASDSSVRSARPKGPKRAWRRDAPGAGFGAPPPGATGADAFAAASAGGAGPCQDGEDRAENRRPGAGRWPADDSTAAAEPLHVRVASGPSRCFRIAPAKPGPRRRRRAVLSAGLGAQAACGRPAGRLPAAANWTRPVPLRPERPGAAAADLGRHLESGTTNLMVTVTVTVTIGPCKQPCLRLSAASEEITCAPVKRSKSE